MKEKNEQLDFPIVPDSDGFSLESDNKDIPYKLSISLDPNIYLLYKTDGNKISEEEGYPAQFIQTGLMIAFMENKDIPQNGNCKLSFDLSEDNSYLIIKTNILENKKVEEESITEQQEKGSRKILNKVFKKRNKN